MRIAVIGTGYVGLVTGVVMADLGNEVVCIDNNLEKVEMLRKGVSPIFEPGLEPLLQQTLRTGQLVISDSVVEGIKGAKIVFIAVGTPPAEDGSPDLSFVRQVAHEIAGAMEGYLVIVNKSTVPVGTGDLVESILREHGISDDRFDVVSNPEFLREGSAVEDTLHPDRIVIGVNRREAAEKLVILYAPLESSMIITDRASAELIKYASNCFLAMKISFINAISRICEQCGADVGVVAKGIGTDARIGKQFLQAGLGWGGSCLPKDVQGLMAVSRNLGYEFELLKEVWDINEEQSVHFLDRLRTRLGGFAGKTIGLLGLAFKPNTDDIRHATSLTIIEKLKSEGATVRVFDPEAMANVKAIFPDIAYETGPYPVADGADAVILVTDWPEFRRIDLSKMAGTMRTTILFDGRRFFYRAQAEAAGIEYFTVGS